MHLQLMCHPRMCAPTNGFQRPVHSTPSVFAAKSVGGKFQLCSMQNSNGPSSENFMTIGGCFECYTYHVTALGWLKKREKKRKKKKDEHL